MTPASLPDWFVIYLKGVCMGVADTIPGVSGGTIALIVGIYDRLVTAIASLDPRILLTLTALHQPQHRKTVREELNAMDIGFLIALGFGAITAVIVFSGITAQALSLYQAPTNAFFFGLIAASAAVLYQEVQFNTLPRIIIAIIGIFIAYTVTGITATTGFTHSLPVVFLTGIITSSAMLLPGISGAAFLYLLGQYEYIVQILYEFLGALTSPSELSAAIAPGIVISVFITGFGIGILTIAHIVTWALHRDRITTLTLLVSLMVGALRLPLEIIETTITTWTLPTLVTVIIPAVLGLVLVLALDYFTEDLSYT